jgi:hypothetical protein
MKLPIGIQDFPSLRQGGYVYIDKTQIIHRLIQGGKYQFLSRPRRFGKSLLISTLEAIFEGEKALFEGLWLEEHYDFTPHPVIRIDFSQLDFGEKTLSESLLRHLGQIAQRQGLSLEANSVKSAFEELILALSERGSVVVLIDEYDKPITDQLFAPQKRLEHQEILRGLYGLLKPMDPYLHFVLLAGVSKIGKLSLFSDLNNLADISLDPEFASLCGYSREEIEHAFPDWLERAWTRLGLSKTQFWDILKFWYNGYSWDGISKLYCPFSFLLFLKNPQFKGYWYDTGTPNFLIEMIKNQQLNPLMFEHLSTVDRTLSTFNVDRLDPISIMFQTGYLTIQDVEPRLSGVRYTLSYPNEEVRQAFSSGLLENYARQPGSFMDSLAYRLGESLIRLEWEEFFLALKAAYASIPNLIVPDHEKHFHALFHMLMCATGLPVQSELLTNKGRIDTVVDTREHWVIFEFKLGGTPRDALEQIRVKDYAQSFTRPVYKVGVVFDLEGRNVGSWEVDS